MERKASVNRTTKETDIAITLNLDGSGKADLSTGIGFFDHMLDGFARHGFFDLDCKVKGDLQVDGHHTVEDRYRLRRSHQKSSGRQEGNQPLRLFCPAHG